MRPRVHSSAQMNLTMTTNTQNHSYRLLDKQQKLLGEALRAEEATSHFSYSFGF